MSDNSKMDTEEEIALLEEKLDRMQLDVQGKMPSAIKELTHRVLYTHALVESSLKTHIADYFLKMATIGVDPNIVPDATFAGWAVLIGSTSDLIESFPFSKILETAKKLTVITPSLCSVLTILNRTRNKLAHPSDKKYLEFNDRTKYCAALECSLISLTEIYKLELFYDEIEKKMNKSK